MDLKTRKVKIAVLIFSLFILFNISKFIKVKVSNTDLPKAKVVFSSGDKGDTEIYSMQLNGSHLKRLTKYSNFGTTFDTWIFDGLPSFSPDGEKIVFDSDRDYEGQRREFIYDFQGRAIGDRSPAHPKEIYIMDSNGKNQARLTYAQIFKGNAIFSPNGKKILFESALTNGADHKEIKLINSDGTNERFLTGTGRLGSEKFKFSPNSEKVFFIKRGELYVWDVEGTNEVRLTHFNPQDTEYSQKVDNQPYIEDFCLSPDSKEIAFVTTERKDLQFTFYIINIDGLNMREIARLNNPDQEGYTGYIKGMKFSSDNEEIAFLGKFWDINYIYILDRKDNFSIIRNLIPGRESYIQNIEVFSFTPDIKQVIFTARFPYGLYDDWYIWVKATIHEIVLGNLGYLIFRRIFSTRFDNKYLCIIDTEGKNFHRIVKLPCGAEFSENFIHWEK